MADTDTKAADPPRAEEEQAAEEDCSAEFKPIVQLDEVETTTGEEQEELVLELKSKLYRFDIDEWKERGVGFVKLLKHKESGKVRLLMREDKTLKVRANHLILPSAKLQEHAGSEKAWVWSTVDFAEEEQKSEMFCIRFGTAEKAKEFKEAYEKAMEGNEEILKDAPAADTKENENKEAVAELAEKVKEAVKVSQ